MLTNSQTTNINLFGMVYIKRRIECMLPSFTFNAEQTKPTRKELLHIAIAIAIAISCTRSCTRSSRSWRCKMKEREQNGGLHWIESANEKRQVCVLLRFCPC